MAFAVVIVVDGKWRTGKKNNCQKKQDRKMQYH